ncbi:DUF2510 domain-containing protein [Agreia pratensis]|uniref:PH domain-containing protein n=1 Tax=Agreia pratensis TaxID=150121 RepID=A0A1X7KR95_9MICO|nr:PH domain-containing protein [Agreia pratensis]MBF4635660.1 DUF2510 domain-containing protein [Agreia pratensis]SMG43324.1 PH domain-containing protein [Agreia pratensis]
MTDVAAGWYDDGSGGKRWWDGRAWTTRQADMPKPTASYAPKPKLPEGTRWAAVGNPISKVGAGRYLVIHDHLFVHLGDAERTLHDVAVIDITEVDVVQSTLQKTRGLATIRVTVGHGDDTNLLTLDDVREFREGVAAITGAIADARLAANGSLASARPEPVAERAPDAAAPARDFIAELGALAAFHRDGVLTDDEFAAAKRKLLAL